MDEETAKKILEKVRRDYDLISDDWDKSRSRMWPEVEAVTRSVTPCAAVLDAGCGNGRLFPYIKKQKANYLGFDGSKELIAICKKKYGNKYFFVGDVLDKKYLLTKVGDKKFDFVFFVAVLHHIPSKKLRIKTLYNLKELLKPNGKIVITVWNLWQRKYLKSIIRAAWLKIIGKSNLDWGDFRIGFFSKTDRYLHAFTMSELKNLAKKAGLVIEGVKKIKGNYILVAKKN